MTTTKKRLNITLSSDTEKILRELARRDNVPQARKALDLLCLALQIEEDAVWDTIASKRDTKKAKFISHRDAWS